MNLASSVQLGTFLFGGAENAKTKERTETVRIFKTAREDIPDNAMEAYRERNARELEDRENGIITEQDGDFQPDATDEFDQMKATDLKALCKEYGLKVSGKKAELQERLRGHFLTMSSTDTAIAPLTSNDDYDSMSLEELQDTCKARCLDCKGTKAKLMKELRTDDTWMREVTAQTIMNNPEKDSSAIYREISDTLEKAVNNGDNKVLQDILKGIKAKNEEEPKYVDIKITSLGMTPDKFTVGGAPSATADVLRKLAGDPFADPPKYGTVSFVIILQNTLVWIK